MDPEMDLVTRSKTDEENSSTTVQVPAELFKSLLSSVERFNAVQTTVEHLQQAVSRLENENVSLQSELQVLHDGKGPRFPQFSTFPIEIRKMIWGYAFATPRIHIIESSRSTYRFSRSKIHTLMHVCKESRECIKALQTPCAWLVWDTDYKDYKMTDTRQFINLDVDTVWLTGKLPSAVLRDPNLDDDLIVNDRSNETRRSGKRRLNCLALCSYLWENPIVLSDCQSPGTVHKLWQFGSPKQLFIVEHWPEIITDASKVKFIEPRWPPCRGVGFRDSLYVDEEEEPSITEVTTWQEVALRVENILRQYKDVHRMSEEEFFEAHGFNAEPDWKQDTFPDDAEWEVPKVTYVEAIEYNPDWFQYPVYHDKEGDDEM